MKRNKLLRIVILFLMTTLMSGCIAGTIARPSEYFTDVKALRYLAKEKEDGEIEWGDTDKDESGNLLPIPSMGEIEGNGMSMDNYIMLSLQRKNDKETVVALSFNIVADRAGTIRIVLRDTDDLKEEPIFVKTFNLDSFESGGFILAGIELTSKSKCLYIGNEPPESNIKDYDGYEMKWKIKDFQIVLASEQ